MSQFCIIASESLHKCGMLAAYYSILVLTIHYIIYSTLNETIRAATAQWLPYTTRTTAVSVPTEQTRRTEDDWTVYGQRRARTQTVHCGVCLLLKATVGGAPWTRTTIWSSFLPRFVANGAVIFTAITKSTRLVTNANQPEVLSYHVERSNQPRFL